MKNLETFLNPSSIAVVGASRDTKKLGSIVIQNLMTSGFKGEIYPVNPASNEILGFKSYASINDITTTTDLVIIAVKVDIVLQIVLEAAKKGVKNFIIFTAGFGESGETGRRLEGKLKEYIQTFDLNVLGPNCLGFVNVDAKMNATFGEALMQNGNLKFISQSGAIATAFFDWAEAHSIGYNKFFTLGNKSGINENHLLEYFIKNRVLEHYTGLSKVNPIGIYLESISEGTQLINLLSQITLLDPVFVLKPGRTESSTKAMQSHTGSMAGSDKVFESAIQKSGAIRCDGIEDFFDLAKAFSWEDAPEGNEIVVISNAGGPAVVLTDFIEKYGLKLGELHEPTIKRLHKTFDGNVSTHNPIDVLGDALAERFAECLDATLSQENISAAIVILTPQVMTEIYLTAELISKIASRHDKTVICSFVGGTSIKEAEKVLNQYKIPNFKYPERAAYVLGKMYQWKRDSMERLLEVKSFTNISIPTEINTADTTTISEIITNAKERKSHLSKLPLNSFEIEKIIESWGITLPFSQVIVDQEEATEIFRQKCKPMAMKIIAPELLHKTEVKGVLLDLDSESKIIDAYHQLRSTINSFNFDLQKQSMIQIQEMVPGGVELIMGLKRDEEFGHIVLFGAGGKYAELIQDVNTELLPIDELDAVKLIKKSKAYKLLNGFRGGPVYSIQEIARLMVRLSEIIESFPEIDTLEVNPLIVTESGLYLVDCKGIISV